MTRHDDNHNGRPASGHTTAASRRAHEIRRLLDLETRGLRVGIVGREWCEACGEEAGFSGFAGAMATHTWHGRFVCWSCRNKAAATGGPSADLDALILERGWRPCAGCGRQVPLREPTLEEARRDPFTCEACVGLDRGRAARLRYLLHEAEKEGGLERVAAHFAWAKAGIEAILRDRAEDED